jgi:hypothetical protein
VGRPDINDGSTQRADLDGRNVPTIIPDGQRRPGRSGIEIPRVKARRGGPTTVRWAAGADQSRSGKSDHLLVDRGDPPRGNSVNRASMDGHPKAPQEREILLIGLNNPVQGKADRELTTKIMQSLPYGLMANGSYSTIAG